MRQCVQCTKEAVWRVETSSRNKIRIVILCKEHGKAEIEAGWKAEAKVNAFYLPTWEPMTAEEALKYEEEE